jgi:hypothetical protein
MLRFIHGHYPEKGKTPQSAAAHGRAPRAVARTRVAAGAALGAGPAQSKVRADLRRQVKLMARHPENDAIDAWIEAAYDWSDWK